MQFRFLFVLLPFSFVISCRKVNSNLDIDNEYQSVIDNAIAEQEFMGIISTVNNHIIKTKNAEGSFKSMALCDTLVKISGDLDWFSNPAISSGPPTFTLALSNLTCNPMPETGMARSRQGHLWIRLWKRLQDPSSGSHNATIKMMNYKASFDPNKPITYECDSITLTTLSNNANTGERLFRVVVYRGKCKSATWNIDYTADRYINVDTFKDNDRSNDVISIWGNSEGKNRNGRKFTVSVNQNTPLKKHASCSFISSGVLTLIPEGLTSRSIDYSNGTNQDACDDKATITINGITQTINLK